MALVLKNLLADAGDIGDATSIPGSGRSPGVGNGNPQNQVSHGQRRLVGYNPQDHRELDTTEATAHTQTKADSQGPQKFGGRKVIKFYLYFIFSAN